MSLPVLQGKGFLITELELRYSKNGTPWVRLPLLFRNSRLQDGTWVHDREILIEGTAFGRLAENLFETVTTRQELWVLANPYVEEYQGKTYIKANVLAAHPVREERDGEPAPARASSSEGDLPF